MSETIRDRIRRQARWCLLASLGGLLLFGSTAVFGLGRPQPVAIAVGWLIFAGALVAIRWIKCPKCAARIGQTIAMPLVFPRFLGQRPNYCLYCGVCLDEPMPQASATSQSQNPIK